MDSNYILCRSYTFLSYRYIDEFYFFFFFLNTQVYFFWGVLMVYLFRLFVFYTTLLTHLKQKKKLDRTHNAKLDNN